MKGSDDMYKVTIEKDGKIIRVEDNMTAVMLTGDKGDSAPQVIEGECSPAMALGLLELFKHAILKRM